MMHFAAVYTDSLTEDSVEVYIISYDRNSVAVLQAEHHHDDKVGVASQA